MLKSCLLAAVFSLVALPALAQEWVWPWPFEQAKKEIGVDFKERKIPVEDAEVRKWSGILFERRFQDQDGKLVELREEKIVLAIAGSSKPLNVPKSNLKPVDRLYVRNLEIDLAKEMKEPGADKLEEVTAAQDANERQQAYEDARAARKKIQAPLPLPPKNLRTWTDRLGKNKIEAAFVKAISKYEIEVKTAEGKTIKLKINGLSKADREYAQGLMKGTELKE